MNRFLFIILFGLSRSITLDCEVLRESRIIEVTPTTFKIESQIGDEFSKLAIGYRPIERDFPGNFAVLENMIFKKTKLRCFLVPEFSIEAVEMQILEIETDLEELAQRACDPTYIQYSNYLKNLNTLIKVDDNEEIDQIFSDYQKESEEQFVKKKKSFEGKNNQKNKKKFFEYVWIEKIMSAELLSSYDSVFFDPNETTKPMISKTCLLFKGDLLEDNSSGVAKLTLFRVAFLKFESELISFTKFVQNLYLEDMAVKKLFDFISINNHRLFSAMKNGSCLHCSNCMVEKESRRVVYTHNKKERSKDIIDNYNFAFIQKFMNIRVYEVIYKRTNQIDLSAIFSVEKDFMKVYNSFMNFIFETHYKQVQTPKISALDYNDSWNSFRLDFEEYQKAPITKEARLRLIAQLEAKLHLMVNQQKDEQRVTVLISENRSDLTEIERPLSYFTNDHYYDGIGTTEDEWTCDDRTAITKDTLKHNEFATSMLSQGFVGLELFRWLKFVIKKSEWRVEVALTILFAVI